jgi:hypothetical protein
MEITETEPPERILQARDDLLFFACRDKGITAVPHEGGIRLTDMDDATKVQIILTMEEAGFVGRWLDRATWPTFEGAITKAIAGSSLLNRRAGK